MYKQARRQVWPDNEVTGAGIVCEQCKAVVKRLTEPKPTVSSQNRFSIWNRFQVLAQDEAEILLKTLKTWVKLIMTNIKLLKIIIVQSHFQR